MRITELLEIEFAKVAGLTPEEHKNVLGNKQKYIDAALKAHNAVIREILKDLREFAKNEVQMRRFNKSQFEAALLYQLNICEQKYGGKDV